MWWILQVLVKHSEAHYLKCTVIHVRCWNSLPSLHYGQHVMCDDTWYTNTLITLIGMFLFLLDSIVFINTKTMKLMCFYFRIIFHLMTLLFYFICWFIYIYFPKTYFFSRMTWGFIFSFHLLHLLHFPYSFFLIIPNNSLAPRPPPPAPQWWRPSGDLHTKPHLQSHTNFYTQVFAGTQEITTSPPLILVPPLPLPSLHTHTHTNQYLRAVSLRGEEENEEREKEGEEGREDEWTLERC